jgi:hypothetical protein
MGELLAFRPRGSEPRVRLLCGIGALAESAEILFFTGVRFGRLEDYPEHPKSKRNALRRRPCRAERRER